MTGVMLKCKDNVYMMTRLHDGRLVLIQDLDQLLQGLLKLVHTQGALSCSNTSLIFMTVGDMLKCKDYNLFTF